MSGIAFILKNQGVSSSPLGIVHTSEDGAESVATAYCTAIGDTTYKPEIKAMVLSFYKAGIYSKFHAIYPILGGTLSEQRVNLVSPGTNDAFVGANASAGADGKHIQFVNTIGVGAKNPAFLGTAGEEWATITSAFKNPSLNGGVFFWASTAPSTDAVGFKIGTVALSPNGAQPYINAGSILNLGGNIKSAPLRIVTFKSNSDEKYYGAVNGGAYQSTSMSSASLRLRVQANIGLGADWYGARNTTEGATITADATIFGGDIYFHAVGKLTKEEALIADGIVAEFLAAVKGI